MARILAPNLLNNFIGKKTGTNCPFILKEVVKIWQIPLPTAEKNLLISLLFGRVRYLLIAELRRFSNSSSFIEMDMRMFSTGPHFFLRYLNITLSRSPTVS